MNAKKVISLLGVLFFWVLETFSFSISDAQSIVEKFYRNLQIIAEEHYDSNGEDTETAYRAKTDALNLCFDINISLPNEFFQFGFRSNETFMGASAYMQRLREFSTTKQNVKYKPKIVRAKAYEEIKSSKNENSTNFYHVYVDKTISANGISKSYVDTVLICVYDGGKVAKITNLTSGSNLEESVMSLRGKAAEYFAQKKYKEAYDTYLKVIAQDNKEGDAYYRLALMSYHNLGCKNRFKNGKERRQKSYEYIQLAIKYGNYDIKKYANNVKYYMENGQV